jgi:hypothetical protein
MMIDDEITNKWFSSRETLLYALMSEENLKNVKPKEN